MKTYIYMLSYAGCTVSSDKGREKYCPVCCLSVLAIEYIHCRSLEIRTLFVRLFYFRIWLLSTSFPCPFCSFQ